MYQFRGATFYSGLHFRLRRLFTPASCVAIVCIASVFFVLPFDRAEAGASHLQLSHDDKNLLRKLEAALGNIRSLQGDFLQKTVHGDVGGKVFLQRPGRIRLDYAPPIHHLIVADGETVHFWDNEQQQTRTFSQSNTLVGLIASDRPSFTRDVTLTKFKHTLKFLEVSLVVDSFVDQGELTLIFERDSLQLVSWRIFDAQGQTTKVMLFNQVYNRILDSSLFRYVEPSR